MGNVFALLGLRALFVLVESLIARFRYLDETIAIVLGLVGVKLLIEDLVKIGPVASLGIIAVLFEFVAEGAPVYVLGSGDNRYQFVHADVLCFACIRAGERPGNLHGHCRQRAARAAPGPGTRAIQA